MKRFLISNHAKDAEQEEERQKQDEKRKAKMRKYDDSYLEFGFTHKVVNSEDRPQCVVCLKILSVESMLPSKLKRHLETHHPNLAKKDRDFFQRKLGENKQQQASFSRQTHINSNALLASFKVAYRVAQCKKPHTIAEELILPAAVDLVSTMIGEHASQQLLKVPLSNNTIARRIDDMANDINCQLVDFLKNREYALQLDEATDNNKDAHLICYVRFINGGDFSEDLLFCKPISGGTSGQELFEITDSYMVEHGIPWQNCVGICTDGARAMSGRFQGLQARVRSKAPNATWTHCIIHREALAAQCLSKDISDVVETVVKVVNFVKTRPMKARFFAKLCEDMGADHSSLLYYSSARWLSFGNSMLRVFELKNEIHSFLVDENHPCTTNFADPDFLVKTGFLTDLFEKLNVLNRSLQGKESHILQLSDKIAAFKKKLELWKNCTKNEDLACFPQLYSFLQENQLSLPQYLKSAFADFLAKLSLELDKYFPVSEIEAVVWVRNPFIDEVPEYLINEAEQFIDLATDSSMKLKFQALSLIEFWTHAHTAYPLIGIKALRVLIPFATSYLCETGFSAVAAIKTKYRSKLDIEREIRVAISKITPRYNTLCAEKQAHPSH